MPKRTRGKAPLRPAHPHDSLVKWAFKQIPHAKGLLAAVLSREELASVDLETLRIEDGSYVDPALSHLHSDVAFSATMFGERVYFYALVEQQRDPEALMVLRVGQYTMRMWDTLARDPARSVQARDPRGEPSPRAPGIERLPPILPIVIYNGRTRWTAPTAFQDIVLVPEAARVTLLPHIPHFKIRLVDLSEGRLDGLITSALTALGQVVLWCLSVAGDDERMEKEIGRIAGALDEVLAAPDAAAAIAAILRYLGATHPEMPPEKIRKVVENAAGEQAREAIVTFLDQIEEKGRLEGEKRGRQKGRQEGRRNALLELLAGRFGEVSKEGKQRVLEADEETLRRWTLRVLDAASIEEVFATRK